MTLYFINFELKQNLRDYSELFDELYHLGAVRLLKFTWCLKRQNIHSTSLRNHLSRFIYEKDALIVSRVQEWAPQGTRSSPRDLPN